MQMAKTISHGNRIHVAEAPIRCPLDCQKFLCAQMKIDRKCRRATRFGHHQNYVIGVWFADRQSKSLNQTRKDHLCNRFAINRWHSEWTHFRSESN